MYNIKGAEVRLLYKTKTSAPAIIIVLKCFVSHEADTLYRLLKEIIVKLLDYSKRLASKLLTGELIKLDIHVPIILHKCI